MAAEWWWFFALNAMIAAIAVLSKVRPPPPSPRGGGITRRASSAVLQRLRSSIFSFPSIGLHTAPAPLLQPELAAAVSQETEEPAAEASHAKSTVSTPRTIAFAPPPAPSAKEVVEETEDDDDPNAMSMEEAYALVQAAQRLPESKREKEEEEDDPNAMSMEEAYALVQAARRWRPEPEREEGARGSSDVDAKAEEFIQGFKEDLRQQRLNSIFNYTQMLKQRAQGTSRRKPAAQPDQL
ncbi:hypothetical protein PR202_ga16022 [Eleusine coracana subsp. coracana]|uniref:Uncharacterized protein n=1 Tax=Eleusine coracana subsp. coracana TaxID=191504 RepID=A0AAV5CLS2_ELECO|nr:hypothetical protein QOZ80_6AG0533430 [Eleusine coracana subsp. coracana]GJM98968.1 hypothetical protein PR202_ga16022 [Eleusine coracana subsp. coracana]